VFVLKASRLNVVAIDS